MAARRQPAGGHLRGGAGGGGVSLTGIHPVRRSSRTGSATAFAAGGDGGGHALSGAQPGLRVAPLQRRIRRAGQGCVSTPGGLGSTQRGRTAQRWVRHPRQQLPACGGDSRQARGVWRGGDAAERVARLAGAGMLSSVANAHAAASRSRPATLEQGRTPTGRCRAARSSARPCRSPRSSRRCACPPCPAVLSIPSGWADRRRSSSLPVPS